jgi:hypothetical protein
MLNENSFFIDSKNYSEEILVSVCGEIEQKIPADEDNRNFESITF